MDIRNFFAKKPAKAPAAAPPPATQKPKAPAAAPKVSPEAAAPPKPASPNPSPAKAPRAAKSPPKVKSPPKAPAPAATSAHFDEKPKKRKAADVLGFTDEKEDSDSDVEMGATIPPPVEEKKPPKKKKTAGLIDAAGFFGGKEAVPEVVKPAVEKKKDQTFKPLPKKAPAEPQLALTGTTFVFTGVLAGDDVTRELAEDMIKERGGKCTGAVSGRTNYVVCGELLEDGRPVEEGSKFRAAEDKKTTLIRGARAFKQFLQDADAKFKDKAPPVKALPALERPKAAPGLWADRHKPKQNKEMMGNGDIRSKLGKWLDQWERVHLGDPKKRIKPKHEPQNPSARAALLSGPPGIGKSTMAALLCEQRGFEVVEYNASDTRSKKSIEGGLADALGCGSLFGKKGGQRRRRCVIMDEVDGLSASDRGGSAALIKLIKTTATPIICICNDRQSPKVKSLANHCYDLRCKRPMKQIVAKRLVAVAAAEGLTLEQNAAELLVDSCGNDIRQCLNALQMWTQSNASGKATYGDMKGRISAISKDEMQRASTFDAAKMILSDHQRKSHIDRVEAFFHDYTAMPLMVQQSYIQAAMNAKEGGKPLSQLGKLERISEAAERLSDVDLIDRRIRQDQDWSLLPLQASTTVGVGATVGGFCMNPQFSQWFGKNSTTQKNRRQCADLSYRLGHRVSAGREAVRRDYLGPLLRHVSAPLLGGDASGTIERLDAYGLSRDDLMETLPDLELHDKDKPKLFASLDAKAKSAFTRAYNSVGHSAQGLQPASMVVKKKRKKSSTDNMQVDDDDYVSEEDEEEVDVSQLFAKKKRKAPSKKPAARKKKK